MRRRSRVVAVLGGVAVAAATVVAVSGSASAEERTIAVQRVCAGPELGGAPIEATLTTTYPYRLDYPAPDTSVVTATLRIPAAGLPGAATLDGTGTVVIVIANNLDGATAQEMPFDFRRASVGADGYATAQVVTYLPYIRYNNTPSRVTVDVGGFTAAITPRDARGAALPVVTTTCAGGPDRWADLPVDNTIAEVFFGPSYSAVVEGSITADSVTLEWGSAYWYFGPVTGYEILVDEEPVGTPALVYRGTATGLKPDTDYWVRVRALSNGFPSRPGKPIRIRTAALPAPEVVSTAYAVTGTSTLKTSGLKGNLTGTASTETTVATGAAKVGYTFAPTTVSGRYAAILPISAKLTLTESAPSTGTLAAGLTTDSTLTVGLGEVKVVGIPVATPAGCAASAPVPLRLTSTAFDPATGGALAGSYDIPKLTGCGAFTPVLSSVFSGKGNQIALTLAAKR